MKRSRIVHLTSVHSPYDDRIFLKECRSLAGAGYDVTLVAPHTQDELMDGVRIQAVPRSKGRLSRMTLTVWRVYREALRVEAELYHFHDPELIPVGLLLRAQGKKVIYDIHEDMPLSFYYKHYLPRWIRRPLAWLMERVENLASRNFSVLITATSHIAERFQRLNGNTVAVHNYPILQEFAAQAQVIWSQRDFSVVCVGGGITRVRCAREMVEAMGLLPESLPATLRLVGSFEPPSLEEELTRLPGWKRVEALGILDRVGVAKMLGSARAGVVVVYPEPNYVWAKPIKLFEYMSAGIPVIASDFPVWREIVQGAGCGLLVDPLNPKETAQAIEYVLTHPADAEAMGHRGRRAAEGLYHWGTEESKLLRCYENLRGSICA